MEQTQNTQPPVFDQQPQGPQYETYIPMMSFGKAVKTCFKKYFDFKGRARRSEFWWFVLFVFIVTFVWSILGSFISVAVIVGSGGEDFNVTSYIITLSVIIFLPILFLMIPHYAVTTRRLHDTGRSGWWVVLSLIISIAYTATYIMAMIPMWERIDEGASSASQFNVIADTFQDSPALGTILCLLMLASLAVGITILVFEIMDSHSGENKYGPSPKYQ